MLFDCYFFNLRYVWLVDSVALLRWFKSTEDISRPQGNRPGFNTTEPALVTAHQLVSMLTIPPAEQWVGTRAD